MLEQIKQFKLHIFPILCQLIETISFPHDVTFPASSAVGHSCPADPEDDDSELTSTTTLSDDDMSTDGDSVMTETKEDELPREPMRSELMYSDDVIPLKR